MFPQDPISDNLVGVIAIFTIFIGLPISIAIAKIIWRRASGPGPVARADETSRQLAEMQRSLDAMTLEMERIAEGQRFVAKVLADRAPSALPAGGERSSRERSPQ